MALRGEIPRFDNLMSVGTITTGRGHVEGGVYMHGDDILEIPRLADLVSSKSITQQEMDAVLFQGQRLDFRVYHAGVPHPTTWTLTATDDLNSQARFSGLKVFTQKNASDMQPGWRLVTGRHNYDGRAMTVLVARDDVHFNLIMDNPLPHFLRILGPHLNRASRMYSAPKIAGVDMSGDDILEIPKLFDMVHFGMITEQEMDAVLVRKQSLVFTVYHARDSQPTTWTLRTSEDPNYEALFTGLTDFTRKNAADMQPGCILVFGRHDCDGRAFTVLIARDRAHFDQIRDNPDPHFNSIWKKLSFPATNDSTAGGHGEDEEEPAKKKRKHDVGPSN